MTQFSPPNPRTNSASDANRGAAVTPAGSGAALVESLQSQLALYEQLNAFSHRQGALIGVGDGSPLLELLSQRQAIIDQLQALHRDFEAKRLGSAPLSDGHRREASELHELIAATRARILEQDERDRAALRDARAQVGGELRKISSSGQAVRAYGGNSTTPAASAPMTSRFTDRKG